MKAYLGSVGRSFLRAFVASIVVLAPGVLEAPNLNRAYALGVAGLIASFTAGIKAIQGLVPGFTFGNVLGKYGGLADSFVRAFAGAFLVAAVGVLNAPNLGEARALGVAALVGAVAAGTRAVEGFFTAGEFPKPDHGT